MNFNWIPILLIFDAGVLSAMLLILRMLRTERSQSRSEFAELRSQLQALVSQADEHKAQVQELEMRLGESQRTMLTAPRPQFVPAPALSADKRAEALEMLRGGADTSTVSVRLHLSEAETALLGKVQVMLRSRSAH